MVCRAKADCFMSIDKTFNGKTVVLQLGQSLELRLDENPTTGYRWSLENINPEVIGLEQDHYNSPETSAIGAGGQHLWEFRGLARGQGIVRLKHWQSWSGEASITETFEITIVV
jgi:inhibitor of cysteine peptidase